MYTGTLCMAMAWKTLGKMDLEYTTQLQPILERMTVGVAILDCATLRVLYANAYMASFCPEPWRTRGLVGSCVDEVLPPDIYTFAGPLFQQVCACGEKISRSEIPYEGFLETRGRTYWRISLELAPPLENEAEAQTLLVMLEDVTNSVRSRLQLEAIHHISAAIAGQSPLHDVLDRILLAMHDLVGSRRCAVLLIDEEQPDTEPEEHASQEEQAAQSEHLQQTLPSVTLVAHQGLYTGAENWHPPVNERLLLCKALLTRQALVVPDTSTMPEIEFPILDDYGWPRRPGSAVCVPILETLPAGMRGAVLGSIEIYHRRARGLPKEEVELLEQFALQAGLAIQNARLFQRIKRLARVASQQAHQLENVMRAIPDGVIIYDANWHLVEINHFARRLLGWSNDDIGLHISQAVTRSKARFPQNSPLVSELIARMEQQAEHQTVDEFEMIGADGRAYTMRRSKAPIRDETGQIFAYVVVYHDVTEQAAARRQIEDEVKMRTAQLAQRNMDLQETQAALRVYNDRLQLLLECLPAGVMVIALEDRRVALMNNQAIQLLERMGAPLPMAESHGTATQETLPDAVGMKIEELLSGVTMYDVTDAVVPPEKQPLHQALYQGKASEAELHVRQADGQILNLLANAAPLLASDGTATHIVLVWQDITWIKVLERAREDFFTTMAHELKTPLANIRAHLSALQAHDVAWSAEDQANFLHTADEQVERLVGMINHFLDASRVEAGALRPELEPILISEMFEDLQDRLEALIASSQRHLEIFAPGTLPAVCADYELIISVLINLLSNAFHYTPVGAIVRLEAEVKREHGQLQGVTLRVSDQGPGISPERQTELFTRFSTFAAARRPAANRPGQMAGEQPAQQRGRGRWSPATGLGLYISKGIIEAHGSQLELHSKPGAGTTFAFTLALASQVRPAFE
ncbi:MAG TPA: ATP-binding protein [Ktedonobacteraceae bacterium]|nr:ATP-binding protein [Ktedonobacteraceae bacterium]